MSGRRWRLVALLFWFKYVITDAIPWFLDTWGMTGGVIASAVVGILAPFAILLPVRERESTKLR